MCGIFRCEVSPVNPLVLGPIPKRRLWQNGVPCRQTTMTETSRSTWRLASSNCPRWRRSIPTQSVSSVELWPRWRYTAVGSGGCGDGGLAVCVSPQAVPATKATLLPRVSEPITALRVRRLTARRRPVTMSRSSSLPAVPPSARLPPRNWLTWTTATWRSQRERDY